MKKLGSLNICATIVLVSIATTPAAKAQSGLGGVLGGLGVPAVGGAAPVSAADLSSGLGGLSATFAGSLQNMLTAEALSAKAFGLKADAEQLEKLAAYYGKGNVEDYDQVKRDISVSADTQAKIDEKMAHAQTLDADSKKQLSAAAPYYALGTAHAAQLPGQYAAWVGRAQTAMKNPAALVTNPGLVAQVPKVVQLSAGLPDLTGKWITVTKGFVTFTQKQKIDTGDLSAKVGSL
jgi:hypothetical protein